MYGSSSDKRKGGRNMPEFYTAIMMESDEVVWRPKSNAALSDSGPEDGRLNIEFEGDLEKMPWITKFSGGKAAIDINMLVSCQPQLFDRAWLRNRGTQEADVAVMGNHYMIDLRLPAAREGNPGLG